MMICQHLRLAAGCLGAVLAAPAPAQDLPKADQVVSKLPIRPQTLTAGAPRQGPPADPRAQLRYHEEMAAHLKAKAAWEDGIEAKERLRTDILLFAGGFADDVFKDAAGIANGEFNEHTLAAVKAFQERQGWTPDGALTPAQRDRLAAVASVPLGEWGFRKVSHPARPVAIWVPLGLGLRAEPVENGLEFSGPRSELFIRFQTFPNAGQAAIYAGLIAELKAKGAEVQIADSATGNDQGAGHYVRARYKTGSFQNAIFHRRQDGPNVTGFSFWWSDAADAALGRRVPALMNTSLVAHMGGWPAPDPAELDPNHYAKAGTGFFVGQDGSFVTNAHVIQGCTRVVVRASARDGQGAMEMRVVARDEENDLALLRTAKPPEQVAPARVRAGADDAARLGEAIALFGYPQSDKLSAKGNFTRGDIMGLSRDERFVQVSAPVQSGNAGGPLLDAWGNVVGVVTGRMNAMKTAEEDGDGPRSANFAIRSSVLAAFLAANRVEFTPARPGWSWRTLSSTDLAERAKAVSGHVQCR